MTNENQLKVTKHNGDNMKHSLSQVKSSHIYLYSAFHNTDCIKAASQW